METEIDKKISTKHGEKKETSYAKKEEKIEEVLVKEAPPTKPFASEVKEEAPPSSSKKKVLIALISVVIIVALVFVVYYYLSPEEVQKVVTVKESEPATSQPESPPEEPKEEPKVASLTEEKPEEVISPPVENKTVVEVPFESTEGKVEAAEYVLKEGEKIIRRGNFIKARSSSVITLGRASLILVPGGEASGYKVVFDKFSTGKPQKVDHVYLMEKEPLNTRNIIEYGIDLGELKALEGVQEYIVPIPPKNKDPSAYRIVTLFEPHYQIIVANAPIEPVRQ
ncbi:MAG: hypothetical protein QW331_00995 [Candidatus Woesearchaeota archaeon]